jgi:hypothetical protein
MTNVQPAGRLDLSKEPGISLTKAAHLPQYCRDGRPSNPSTLYRHCTNGVLHNGRRLRLEHVRQGGRVVTSVKAVERFFERLALGSDADASPPLPSTSKDAHANAAKRLELAGL